MIAAKKVNNKLQDLKDFVIQWNVDFPIDRWWRKKYSVAFNSPEHRAVSLIDMRFEWEEDELFEEINNKPEYKPGDFLKKDRFNKEGKTEEELNEEFIEEFKNIDLSQFRREK